MFAFACLRIYLLLEHDSSVVTLFNNGFHVMKLLHCCFGFIQQPFGP